MLCLTDVCYLSCRSVCCVCWFAVGVFSAPSVFFWLVCRRLFSLSLSFSLSPLSPLLSLSSPHATLHKSSVSATKSSAKKRGQFTESDFEVVAD